MKNKLFTVSLLIIVVLLNSCKSGISINTPTNTIKAMSLEAKNGDLKVIGKFMCSADAKAFEAAMEKMKGIGELLKPMMEAEMKKSYTKYKDNVEFKNEKITGDKATLDVLDKTTGNTETLNFAKENGAWKICMGIADKMNENKGGNENIDDALNKGKEMLKNMTPEQKEAAMKMSKEMLQKLKPEEIEKLMKTGAESMKNMSTKDLEEMKKLSEAFKDN